MPLITISPGKLDAFFNIVDNIEISELAREALRTAHIDQVMVCPDEKTWRLSISAKQDIDTLALKALEDRFISDVPGLDRVCIDLNDNVSEMIESGSDAAVAAASDMSPRVFTVETAASRPAAAPVSVPEDVAARVLTAETAASRPAAAPVAVPEDVAPRVLFGRSFNGKCRPISSLGDGDKGVIVAGKVIRAEVLQSKNGRKARRISFIVTDREDSVSCLIFEKRGIGLPDLKTGKHVKVLGNVKQDRFAREIVLYPDSLIEIPATRRKDTAPVKRVELHAHTKMSALDAVVSPSELVKTAASFGHRAVAITDHGVVQAFPEFYKAAKSAGIKPVFGLEGYLVDCEAGKHEKARSWHILILARNSTGLTNLYRLVSTSHIDTYYKKPRIPRHILDKYREGLILGTACEAGELFQALLDGADDRKLKEIASYYDFAEIQPIGNNAFLKNDSGYPEITSDEHLRQLNRRIFELGIQLGKPVVATGDVHFLEPEDAMFRAVLMVGQKYSDAHNQAPLYLKTTDEMLEEFSYLGEEEAQQVVVDNTVKLADSIEEMKPVPEGFFPPEIDEAEEVVRNTAYNRAREIYGDPLPEIVDNRLKRELDAICGNGFAVLYYISMKLVNFSLEKGFLVGSRGSVGSSFVATVCGITEVNPLPPHQYCPDCKHFELVEDAGCGIDLPLRQCPRCPSYLQRAGFNIPFETFMGFKGDKVPDIDLNFSGEIQLKVHRYVEEFFGRENAFKAGTISTIKERTAMGFVRGYFESLQSDYRKAEMLRLVDACTGIKRTTGQHPGGIILVPEGMDINRFTPVQRPANDKTSSVVTTHFDYHVMDKQLVKLDILGHDDPTILRMLSDITGIDVKQIPMDDQETMKLFRQARTTGIPEFGTRFVREMVKATKPSCFADLIRISGLSHGTDVWLGNAAELIRKGIPLSRVISIRDDIMNDLIGYGLPAADAFQITEKVRKGKGLTADEKKLMIQHEVPKWYIESCEKIKYMFPKAHAVAYVTSAWRIAWFKVHRPLAFFATHFSVRRPDMDCTLLLGGPEQIARKIKYIEGKLSFDRVAGDSGTELSNREKEILPDLEIALEAYEEGFKFLPVHISKSASSRFLVEEGGLRCPFSSLPGVGPSAAESLISVRDEGFTSVEAMKSKAGISQAVVEALRSQGCLEGIPEQDQLSLF